MAKYFKQFSELFPGEFVTSACDFDENIIWKYTDNPLEEHIGLLPKHYSLVYK